MARPVKTVALLAFSAGATAILIFAAMAGCQPNQNNSPISINNSRSRPSLSVACSTDGAVAYVTDGRNVFRYDRTPVGQASVWQCILTETERQDLAMQRSDELKK